MSSRTKAILGRLEILMRSTQERLPLRFISLALLTLLLSTSFAFAQASSQTAAKASDRPKITGISHVAFFTTDKAAAKKFYNGLLGLTEDPKVAGRYFVGADQAIELEDMPAGGVPDQLSHIAFATPDAEGVRAYLAAHGVAVPEKVNVTDNGTKWFPLKDPEQHPIEFVQDGQVAAQPVPASALSRRIIHAGFVVHDRALEDHFYKDLLGFHVYWHGGMKDAETDWVDMQVPDGTQWLEYMMVREGTPDHRTLGVLNHVALGLASMNPVPKKLEARGWMPSDAEHAQIGRDGKWQLNLYDPDHTRVELMEFKPTKKPCCSSYTGPHPH